METTTRSPGRIGRNGTGQAYRAWLGMPAAPAVDPDEMAFTRPEVLDARGWDPHHRRYRRRPPAPAFVRSAASDSLTV